MKFSILTGGAAAILALLFYREHGLRIEAEAERALAIEANTQLMNATETLKAEHKKQLAALEAANAEINAEAARICTITQNITAARVNETQDLKNFVNDFSKFTARLFIEE